MNLNKGIKQWAPKDAGTSWYKVMKKEKKKTTEYSGFENQHLQNFGRINIICGVTKPKE